MIWKKGIGFGLALWALMFVLVSVLIALKLYPSYPVLAAFLAGVVSFILSGFAKPKSMNEGLVLGSMFVFVGLILDSFITTKFSPGIFDMWTLWLGYGLALVAPMLKVWYNKR